jgi:hypothetical protein
MIQKVMKHLWRGEGILMKIGFDEMEKGGAK